MSCPPALHIQFTGPGAPVDDPSIKLLILQLKALVTEDKLLKEASQTDQCKLKRLLSAATNKLAEPLDVINSVGYSPLPLVTVRIAQAHGLLDRLNSAGDCDGTLTVPALARATGIAPEFLGPLLDYLCSQRIARRVGTSCFEATRLTRLLAREDSRNAITFYHDLLLPGLSALKDWVCEPLPRQTAWQMGHETDYEFPDWLDHHTELSAMYHRFIESQSAAFSTCLDYLRFDTDLYTPLRRADYAFVDVVGGIGQRCKEVRTAFPYLRGRIVSQDTPEVLKLAQRVGGIELNAYHVLTPQPIKGARVYYLRHLSYNHHEDDYVKILQNQVSAMDANSFIILDERVLPDRRAEADAQALEQRASLSLAIGTMLDTWGRRECQWRDLLASVSLSVKDIRRYTRHDALIIAVLEDQLQFRNFSEVFSI